MLFFSKAISPFSMKKLSEVGPALVCLSDWSMQLKQTIEKFVKTHSLFRLAASIYPAVVEQSIHLGWLVLAGGWDWVDGWIAGSRPVSPAKAECEGSLQFSRHIQRPFM